jgi:type II secretory pathway pseudopilin PulG
LRTARRIGEGGYAMAALLVGLGVMAVLMTAAMPVWKQMSQREKEAELVFRGEQYARAIGLFQRRAGPGVTPPNLDILVDQRFLRRKYKDPITGGDFLPIFQSQAAAAVPGQGRGQPPTAQPGAGRGALPTPQPGAGRGAPPTSGGRGAGPAGGIVGVVSRSTEESIRLYNGRSRYNEWQFIFVPQVQAPGQPTPGGPGGPGQRGAPPGSQTPGGQSPFGPFPGRGGRGASPPG